MTSDTDREIRLLRYQIETLETDNERLRQQVEVCEDILFPKDMRTPPEWLLTGSEARIVVLLARGQTLTKEKLHHFLYEARMLGDAAEPKIVDVFVCKIRKKIKPFGLTINTLHGRGYNFSAETAAEVRRQIAAISGGTAVMQKVA